MIALSIIIVSYNAQADLERCLQSLVQHPPRATHEVIVVDNGSTDESVDVARRFPIVRVIETGRNGGFSVGNNIGIRASQGVNLLLLNSDTIVPPGAVDGLLTCLALHPEVAIVGPRLVDGQGRAEWSFGRMLTPVREWRRQRLMRRLERHHASTTAWVEAETRREQRPDWVSGACLLVRRADAEAVGLLDERYFMYTEDVDFCAAVRARGRQVLFTPAVEIIHLRGRSAATASAATRGAYERSHLAFYQKHQPLMVPLLRLYRLVRGRA
jgi:GT2 family glycosyltransferase